MFRDKNWPMLKYEDFTQDPVARLREYCGQFEIPWDDAMARWPKKLEQIADPGFGNETFVLSRRQLATGDD